MSKKAKRVARLTLAAETLSPSEAADTATFLKMIVEETLEIPIPPVTIFVDDKSLKSRELLVVLCLGFFINFTFLRKLLKEVLSSNQYRIYLCIQHQQV